MIVESHGMRTVVYVKNGKHTVFMLWAKNLKFTFSQCIGKFFSIEITISLLQVIEPIEKIDLVVRYVAFEKFKNSV